MDEHTIRPTPSLVVWCIGALLAAAALVDLALGDLPAFGRAVAPVLLLLWALGLVLARPVIRYDAARLVVRNPLVVHEIGWGAIDAVGRRMQLEVTVHADGRVVAWASPTLRRRRPVPLRRQAVSRGPSEVAPAGDWARDQLTVAWEQARVGGSPQHDVRRRPDLPALVLGALLVVATVIGLLV